MPQKLLLTLSICLFSAGLALAQEHNYGKEEPVTHESVQDHHILDPEVSRMHPPDSAYFGHHLDYLQKAVSRTRKQLETRHDEEETLKFNFLYFIFQRFKISDIID